MFTPTIAQCCELFARLPEIAVLEQPEGAVGNCGLVNGAFSKLLTGFGIEHRLLYCHTWLLNPGPVAPWSWAPPEAATHVVVLVDGVSIDWTARQFDALASVPEVLPLGELERRWRRVRVAWLDRDEGLYKPSQVAP